MVLYEGMKEYMEDKFISEFFELDDELDELGVFDSIMNKDSHFFINILRLKKSKHPNLRMHIIESMTFLKLSCFCWIIQKKNMISYIMQL